MRSGGEHPPNHRRILDALPRFAKLEGHYRTVPHQVCVRARSNRHRLEESYDQHPPRLLNPQSHRLAITLPKTPPKKLLDAACASFRLAPRGFSRSCSPPSCSLSTRAPKYLVVTQMQLGERITVIDGLLWWYSIRNSGAAFSMGENVTWVFTLVMVAAAAGGALPAAPHPRPVLDPRARADCLAVSAATFLTVSSVSPASAPATWSILFPYRTSRFSILQTPQSACAWRSSFCELQGPEPQRNPCAG